MKRVVCKIANDLPLVMNAFVHIYFFFSNLTCENLKAGGTTGHLNKINFIYFTFTRSTFSSIILGSQCMKSLKQEAE